jgi:hypothetical protein
MGLNRFGDMTDGDDEVSSSLALYQTLTSLCLDFGGQNSAQRRENKKNIFHFKDHF